MAYQEDGSVLQTGLQRFDEDHHHESINYPVLGIVLNVYFSDDHRNSSAIPKSNFRGSHAEARVLVLNDGKDATWIIPNVVILPRGSSGIDNFYEELPRPATKHVDDSPLESKGIQTDYYRSDGDFCVVGFIGGNIEQPFMLGWWPHPANTRDPATENRTDQGFLEQSRRLVRRFQGTVFAVTSAGSLCVDTGLANSNLNFKTPSPDGAITRDEMEEGGDVDLTVKSSRQLSVRFDSSVPQPTEEPDLLQPNPAKAGQVARTDVSSKFLMNKDSILAQAGRVAQLAGNNDGTDKTDTVALGELPTDHLVLGEKFRTTFNNMITVLNTLIDAYNAHFHLDSNGLPTSAPTGTPIPNPGFNPLSPPSAANPVNLPSPAATVPNASEMPTTDLSTVSKTE